MENYKNSHEIMMEVEKKIEEHRKHDSFSTDFSVYAKGQILQMYAWVDEYRKLKEESGALLIYIGSYTDQNIMRYQVRDKFYEQIKNYHKKADQTYHKSFSLIQQLKETVTAAREDRQILSSYEEYLCVGCREMHQILRSAWELLLLNEDRDDITSLGMGPG